MSLKDAIENALMVVKKNEVQRTAHPSPPAIIDRVFHVRPATEVTPRYRPINDPPRFSNAAAQRYGELNTPVIRDQIELPRMCVSRRMPWMAAYIIVDGRSKFSHGKQLDDVIQHQVYGDRIHDAIEFRGFDFETCPYCAAKYFGPILCGGCSAFCCGGTIYKRGAEDWYRCICGVDRALISRPFAQIGIFPKVRAQ